MYIVCRLLWWRLVSCVHNHSKITHSVSYPYVNIYIYPIITMIIMFSLWPNKHSSGLIASDLLTHNTSNQISVYNMSYIVEGNHRPILTHHIHHWPSWLIWWWTVLTQIQFTWHAWHWSYHRIQSIYRYITYMSKYHRIQSYLRFYQITNISNFIENHIVSCWNIYCCSFS